MRTRIEYVVEPCEGAWTVSLQDRHFGRYKERRAALHAAVQDARRVRECGQAIAVRVKLANGKIRALSDKLLRTGAF